jgi:hypothetical protein
MRESVILNILAMIWNAFVLAGTTYVVFWKNQSGWWFLLAVILIVSVNDNMKKGE